MSSLADVQVSLFHGSFDPTPKRTVTLKYVLDAIRTGTYARQVREVRQVLAVHGQDAYDKAKRSLPGVTFGGTFDPTRGNAHLKSHSRLLHVDMDHLADVAATKQALSDNPHVVFAFTSPSSGGIKASVLISVVSTAEQYAHAWHVVKADFEQRYGVRWDPATKDVARLCYVSYDPELFVNFDAQVFDVPPVPAPQPRASTPKRQMPLPYHPDRRRMYAERAIRTATDMIQSAPLGTRHHTRLKAARSRKRWSTTLRISSAPSIRSKTGSATAKRTRSALRTWRPSVKNGCVSIAILHRRSARRHRLTPPGPG